MFQYKEIESNTFFEFSTGNIFFEFSKVLQLVNNELFIGYGVQPDNAFPPSMISKKIKKAHIIPLTVKTEKIQFSRDFYGNNPSQFNSKKAEILLYRSTDLTNLIKESSPDKKNSQSMPFKEVSWGRLRDTNNILWISLERVLFLLKGHSGLGLSEMPQIEINRRELTNKIRKLTNDNPDIFKSRKIKFDEVDHLNPNLSKQIGNPTQTYINIEFFDKLDNFYNNKKRIPLSKEKSEIEQFLKKTHTNMVRLSLRDYGNPIKNGINLNNYEIDALDKRIFRHICNVKNRTNALLRSKNKENEHLQSDLRKYMKAIATLKKELNHSPWNKLITAEAIKHIEMVININ